MEQRHSPLARGAVGPLPPRQAAGAFRGATVSSVGRAPGDPLARLTIAASSGIDPDKIYQDVLKGQPPAKSETSQLANQMLALAKTALRKRAAAAATAVQPLGRVARYNPAQDTREGYEAALGRLAETLQTLESEAAPEHHVVAYRLQREAEIDQMFPKQALRARMEAEWKNAALLMREQGVPAEQIRKYLKLKATQVLLPTPDELKAFVEARKQFAAQVFELVRDTGAPIPPPPLSGAVRGQSVERPPAAAGSTPRAMVRPVVMHKA